MAKQRICMYSAQLHMQGGIESVVKELFRIMPVHGVEMFGAVEFGAPQWMEEGRLLELTREREERTKRWREWTAKNGIMTVIFNHVDNEVQKLVLEDMAILKGLGIKCLMMMHSPFPSAMMLDGEEKAHEGERKFLDRADAALTVSWLDAVWWRGMGYRAFHVQNPFLRTGKNAETSRREGEDGAANLLWVGRLCEPKQPKAALAAFARAYEHRKGLRLTMVGGRENGWKPLKKQAREWGCEEAVSFHGARDDISDLWAAADIHLLSSITESFCLVLAEAKNEGIPTIMFEIPFLELVQDKKGLIEVKQGDIEGMAAAMVRLADDAKYRRQLGKEAKETLANFNDETVWQSWQKALEGIENPEMGREVPVEIRHIVQQESMAWEYHCRKHLWEIEMSRNWQLLTKTSLRPFAKGLAGLVRWIRAFRNAAIRGGRK